MRRRKLNKVAFNGKLIIDVVAASLIVQKAPVFVSKYIALENTVQAVVGIGAGYLTGMLLKHPDLSNASIALGAVDLVSPMVDNLIGSTTVTPVLPQTTVQTLPGAGLSGYQRLADYIPVPKTMNFESYKNSY